MNRKHAISLIICIILVVCPLSLSALSISSRKTADWSDGTFEGVWSKLNENTTGSIWGTLNQGRRPNHGTFSAEWNTTDEVGTGTFHGIFYGILI